jgi:hypothetical protein
MRQIGDRRLRWRRTSRFAEYVGAATWQQRATLSVAVAGGLACVYLVVHLLGLEIRVPGLDAPEGTPAFVASPPAHRQQLVVHVPAAVLGERPRAERRAHGGTKSLTRSRRTAAPEVVETPAAAPPTSEAPAPAPPAADAPAPPPQAAAAPAQPPSVDAATVTVAPDVALPPLPEIGLPTVELPPVPPVPPVALPTLP